MHAVFLQRKLLNFLYCIFVLYLYFVIVFVLHSGKANCPPGCYPARPGKAAVSISWSMCSSSCPRRICRVAQNTPWREHVKTGQTLHREASRSSTEHFVTHQSIEPNQSHILLMQKLSGQLLEPSREWVNKCTGSACRQIPSTTVTTTGQAPISFLYQTYKLNPVTLATADIFGN